MSCPGNTPPGDAPVPPSRIDLRGACPGRILTGMGVQFVIWPVFWVWMLLCPIAFFKLGMRIGVRNERRRVELRQMREEMDAFRQGI
jgi:hypothetical protein